MSSLTLADLGDGWPHATVVNGRTVLVGIVDGVPYAMDDTCPHNGASLSTGTLQAGCVTCPWHLWRFDLRTGERSGSPHIRVATYPVTVLPDGTLEIDAPPPSPARSMREVLLAHARGEDVD